MVFDHVSGLLPIAQPIVCCSSLLFAFLINASKLILSGAAFYHGSQPSQLTGLLVLLLVLFRMCFLSGLPAAQPLV